MQVLTYIEMTASDRTREFRQLVKEAAEGVPEAKRRRLNRSPKRNANNHNDGQEVLNKEYMAEGYVIVCLTSSHTTPIVD